MKTKPIRVLNLVLAYRRYDTVLRNFGSKFVVGIKIDIKKFKPLTSTRIFIIIEGYLRLLTDPFGGWGPCSTGG